MPQPDFPFPEALAPLPPRSPCHRRREHTPHPCDLVPLPLYNLGLDRDALFAHNRRLAQKAVRLLWRQSSLVRRMEWEDALQEAELALFRASRTFDKGMGFRFSSPVFKYVRAALLDACVHYVPITLPRAFASGSGSKETQELARRALCVVSLDGPMGGKILAARPGAGNPSSPLVTEEVRDAAKRLPRGERGAVRLCCLDGYSLGAAARLMHCPVREVRAWREAGIRRLAVILGEVT